MSVSQVTLYVYDISQGMAKVLGPSLVGKPVEGVWHSSIVIFGKEYYFQGGIAWAPPKSTPFGNPVKEITIGNTEISEEEFMMYLDSIQSAFTFETYNVFDNNCNHFANTISEFLTGNPIPSDILDQAKEYKNTPIGQLIQGFENSSRNAMQNQAPQMRQMQHPISQNQFQAAPTQNQAPAHIPFGNPHLSFPGAFNPNPHQTSAPGHSSQVEVISDIMVYLEKISTNDKVVIDFYADWCGPCKTIAPKFIQLAESNPAIKFYKVNVDHAPDISGSVGVRAMPTFLFLHKGSEFKRLQGANPAELQKSVQDLSNLN